ncbi:LacI family DNA-binding transcriptional regulator [Galbibacter mesophilus]|uniref:LacI family DNA-binding transcriptional regulator n=1 Tax=Galbibacter mesophilus TaxID=379069 RepID=UPI00191DB92B|nr:LacI family DNA-binding transcriptional regulator [Galbibacter mesophilus]MCM5664346.1 LacI family transcriptional regulator [Galbibacter mesophilus]
MAKISQKDIAEALQISRVTVTKALQEHPDIALKTREAVKKKAAEMGYYPNFIGRNLSQGQTFTIGIILPKIAHSFFAQAVENFYEHAHSKGYNIIPMISFEDPKKEKKNIETLLSMRVDGIVIDVSGKSVDDDNYELIKRSGAKFIFFDRAPVNSKESAVLLNDRELSFEITQLLLDKGYKKICHFTGPEGISISTERKKGYENAMAEAGLKTHLRSTNMGTNDGYKILKEMATENELPEAVFAINDSVAHGIYKAAEELHLKIPDDIAVVGFGDIDTSKLLNPPLTTVKVPLNDMTAFAIDELIDMIQKDTSPKRKTIFSGAIIRRGSI